MTMAKKTKKYITVLLAVLASAAMITETAFAASSAGSSSEASSSVTSSSSSGGSSSPAPSSGGASGTSSNDGNGGVTPPPSNQGTDVNVTMNFNGGTGGATQLAVPRGTAVGDLATPVKKGYKFAGWTSGGNPVSSSLKLTVDITLSAQWAPEAVSSSASQQAPSSSSPAVSVDTHQSEVDAAASQADATISEPDATSSEDWNSLLSSGSSSSSGSAVGALQSSQSSSGAAQSGSGFSTLLAVGIGLIVLALAGIGLFIYLQFFRGRNVPPQGGGSGPRVSDNTIEFTDISSFSGKQEHGHTADPHAEFDRKPAHSRTEPEARPVRSDRDDTRVMPQRFSEAPVKKPDPSVPSPIAQARPVSDAKSEFDWEKFFDSEK